MLYKNNNYHENVINNIITKKEIHHQIMIGESEYD